MIDSKQFGAMTLEILQIALRGGLPMTPDMLDTTVAFRNAAKSLAEGHTILTDAPPVVQETDTAA